ncbi:A24 family peptidase [Candidatus Pacearchaeota archaeon]|jgi:Flp pilus assembly protein protease CpaA|nr:A24 family peptidase [Candidatus Pacearchaeota archaeon]
MYEVIFLWALALAFIIFAVVQDFKTREIANWLNFSLIIFALGFRFFYSFFSGDNFSFFYQGLIGFVIFFLVGNLFYYSRLFAGGDAKMMIALGAILPISSRFFSNVQIFLNFLLIFLLSGFVYTIIMSIILCVKNFKKFRKEFANQLYQKRKLSYLSLVTGIFFLLIGFWNVIFIFVGLLFFVTFYLYIYSKSIDESSMIKTIPTTKLREGDWLYSNVKIGNKVIKAKWDGVSNREIREIMKKHNEVKVREGIVFSPVFLIAFILWIVFTYTGFDLWNPFW